MAVTAKSEADGDSAAGDLPYIDHRHSLRTGATITAAFGRDQRRAVSLIVPAPVRRSGRRVVDGVDRQHLERVLLDRGSVSEAGGADRTQSQLPDLAIEGRPFRGRQIGITKWVK
jgi:hypothetical protein